VHRIFIIVERFAVIRMMIIFHAGTKTENSQQKKYKPVFPERPDAIGKIEV